MKRALKKQEEGTLREEVSRFLLSYRTTPQTTTGCSPAELLYGRPIRTRLTLVKPNLEGRVQGNMEQQKKHHDRNVKHRSFKEGDSVYAKNYRMGQPWVSGYILKISPVMYIVKLGNGETWKRHIEQLKKCYNTEEQHSPNTVEEDFGPTIFRTEPVPMDNTTIIPTPTTTTTSTTTGMRRSTRDKRPPDRYAPEVTH